MTDLVVRAARAGDFEAVKVLLRTAGLPVEDLREPGMRDFLIATRGRSIVGAVGLEPYPQVGLLRSLVVDPGARAAGVGRLLVAELEASAGRRGIAELWLLTIDADRYFQALGYETRERREAPQVIRQTAEFASLCPGDATLMHKRL